MKHASILITALLLGACQTPVATTAESATSGASVQTASVATSSADGSADDVICRSMKVTGTRFAKRECKTAAAWNEYDAYTNQNARESTDRLQRLNTGCSTQAEFGCSH